MKLSTVLAGVLASVASAAPASSSSSSSTAVAEEKRGSFNAAGLNNLAFNSLNLGYLNVINSVDLNLLQQLSINNNLNALAFENIFASNVFNVNTVLQLQQLQTLLQLGQLGVFNTFDLSSLNLQLLQLGLINNVGGFDLGTLVDASLVPQITTIVQQGAVVIGKE